MATFLILLTTPATAATLGPSAPPVTYSPVQATAETQALEPQALVPGFEDHPRLNQAITIDDAVRFALAHSPVIEAAHHDVEQAAEMLAMARAKLAPALAFNGWAVYGDGAVMGTSAGGITPGGMRMFGGGGILSAQATFRYPLYAGGALSGRRDAAAHRRRATEAELQALRQEVAFDTATLARRIILQNALIEIQDALLRTQTERLRVTRSLASNGKVPRFYVLRDEAALAEAAQGRTNARRDRNILLAQLKTQMGLDPTSELTVQGELSRPETVPSRGTQLAEAVQQRPELTAIREKVEATYAEVRAAKGEAGPRLDLLGQANASADETPRWESYLVGVVLGFPILDGGERRAAVRAAEAKRASLTASEKALALQVATEVATADEQRLAAAENVDTAQAVLGSAREDYDVAQERYAAGLGINVEVLDALTVRVRAETNVVSARYELGVSQDALRRAMGSTGVLRETQKESQ